MLGEATVDSFRSESSRRTLRFHMMPHVHGGLSGVDETNKSKSCMKRRIAEHTSFLVSLSQTLFVDEDSRSSTSFQATTKTQTRISPMLVEAGRPR